MADELIKCEGCGAEVEPGCLCEECGGCLENCCLCDVPNSDEEYEAAVAGVEHREEFFWDEV